jgi:hypothetical protein
MAKKKYRRYSPEFKRFLEDLDEKDFKICDWTMTLPMEPYARSDS